MTGEIIQSFLVSLGFDVDDASLKKFNQSISKATVAVSALYGSANIAAAGIAYSFTKVAEGFEEIGYQYRLIYPAVNKAILLRRELFKAYGAAGINLQQTVFAAVRLNMSLTKTKYILEALYKGTAAKFFGILQKQSDLFRRSIYQNLPKIKATLESFVRVLFKAIELTTALGRRAWSILSRVYDFLVALDKRTDGWSTKVIFAIAGIAAAWALLNSGFLATPIGRLIALAGILLAIYDDYKGFREGKTSLINWGPWIKGIDAVTAAFQGMYESIESVLDIVGDLLIAFWRLIHLDFSGFKNSIKYDLTPDAGSLIQKIDKALGLGLFDSLNEDRYSQLGPLGVPSGGFPLGIGAATTNQTNRNASIQVNNSVYGVTDPTKAAALIDNNSSSSVDTWLRNLTSPTDATPVGSNPK